MTDTPIGAEVQWPTGLLNIPPGSSVVTDADEEIMELYMNLATNPCSSNTGIGNLGPLDATRNILELELELEPPAGDVAVDEHIKGRGKGRRERQPKVRTMTVKLQQDLHALKQTKGDTGSVLWRSSMHLIRHILSQHANRSSNPLVNPDRLQSSRILELGAGTGLLSIFLSPLCAEYTVTDRYENLRLIQRNLELNGIGQARHLEKGGKAVHPRDGNTGQSKQRVRIEEVDWLYISKERCKRRKEQKDAEDAAEAFDLVLAVDCVYNEALVQPLVDTLARYCSPGGRTVVWVVVELRSPDVLTLFLDTWLKDPDGPWTIVRLTEDAMGRWDGERAGRWVGWVGWR